MDKITPSKQFFLKMNLKTPIAAIFTCESHFFRHLKCARNGNNILGMDREEKHAPDFYVCMVILASTHITECMEEDSGCVAPDWQVNPSLEGWVKGKKYAQQSYYDEKVQLLHQQQNGKSVRHHAYNIGILRFQDIAVLCNTASCDTHHLSCCSDQTCRGRT
jgi:hypothetical protein